MKNFSKMPLILLICTLIFNILVVSSTILLHEMGHFVAGIYADCRNIKLVLIDSSFDTYTEMICTNEQPIYFSLVGAFLFTLPFALSFLLLKKFPEKNFFWISMGFNLVISMGDLLILPAQILGFVIGTFLIIFGEILLTDRLLLYIEGKE